MKFLKAVDTRIYDGPHELFPLTLTINSVVKVPPGYDVDVEG
jgi:hypothetical protein